MIILGHEYFQNEFLYKIAQKEDVKKTPSNTTVLLGFEQNDIISTIKYLSEQNISFAIYAKDVKEVIFASNFGAKYILVDAPLAENAQKIANDYLFDSKILVKIFDEDMIEKFSLLGLDGVIFNEALK